MTATWSDIFADVDGPPVLGEPGDFQGAQRSFESMRDDAQEALEQFNRITSDGGVSQLQGQAATAFERFVDEVAGSLGDLPGVADEAAAVFRKHADDLVDLRDEVDRALVRAQTNWTEQIRLKRELVQADRRLEQLQRQIDELPSDAADPTAATQRTGLDTDRTTAGRESSSLSTGLGNVEDALAGIRREWTGFHRREAELRSHTRQALDSIELGDLKDPGHFKAFAEGAFAFVMNVTMMDELLDFIDAIMDGDWAAVLWKLREILDVVLLVIAVVALFTPLAPLVVAIAIGLAVAKLAIDVALYATKWPNPANGEVISATDLVMDAVAIGGFGWLRYGQVAGKFQPTLLQTGRHVVSLRGADLATTARVLGPYGVKPIFNVTTLNNAPLGAVTGLTGVKMFVATKGWAVKSAVANIARFPQTVFVTPQADVLSTDVFQSMADGHSDPATIPEKLTVFIAPFTVRNTTCVSAP